MTAPRPSWLRRATALPGWLPLAAALAVLLLGPVLQVPAMAARLLPDWRSDVPVLCHGGAPADPAFAQDELCALCLVAVPVPLAAAPALPRYRAERIRPESRAARWQGVLPRRRRRARPPAQAPPKRANDLDIRLVLIASE